MRARSGRRENRAGWGVIASLLAACGQAKPPPAVVPVYGPHDAGAPDAFTSPSLDGGVDANALVIDAAAPLATTSDAAESAPESDGGALVSTDGGDAAACPEGMMLVDSTYCPRMERTCIDEEYSPQNHIVICHRFSEKQKCVGREEHRRFCIDQYEYPNRAGAHPPWMVSWFDAEATCQSQGKRLCYESEWVTACEGPDKSPFPYGFSRDNAKCNIDNSWIQPSLAAVYSKDPEVAQRELSRLDQSVTSGARPECVSGFGVHDMTGNFDEWVTADRSHDDKSKWTGLKGGAWGHVRNACRPVTTSHPPDFTYYFIAFRCCKDTPGSPPYVPESQADIPKVDAGDRAPIPAPVDPPGPSSVKVAPERWPKPAAP